MSGEIVNFEYLILLRLVAAVVLGGIIGFERGGSHDAGLRTHIIVCLGAASIMILSECIVNKYGIHEELLRMGAQVVSGVGFLGVGSIIVDGNRVRGITTAAGLWTTACVGLVVGSGYYILAITIVALMIFAMYGLKSIANHLKAKAVVYNIKVELDMAESIKKVLSYLKTKTISIKSVRMEEKKGKTILVLDIGLPRNVTIENVISELAGLEGIREMAES